MYFCRCLVVYSHRVTLPLPLCKVCQMVYLPFLLHIQRLVVMGKAILVDNPLRKNGITVAYVEGPVVVNIVEGPVVIALQGTENAMFVAILEMENVLDAMVVADILFN